VGARFEIERGGCWLEILENIKKFVSLKSSKVKIKLATTVNLQNVLYLDDVTSLAKTLGIDIVWGYLEDPEFLCIDYATEKTRQSVIAKYRNHQDSELKRIEHRMQHCPGSDGRKFLEYTQKLDARRSQRFSDTHLEIFTAMGGCVSQCDMLKSTS
jgi:MoaA/NifB/PqqE/SkfB family radical SAM enzyme